MVGIIHTSIHRSGELTFAGVLVDEGTVAFVSGCDGNAAGIAIIGSRSIGVAAGISTILDGCLRQLQVQGGSLVGFLRSDGGFWLCEGGTAGEQTEEKEGMGLHFCWVLV